MSFYSEMSRFYDGLFAVEQGSMDFVVSLIANCKRVLDVGCATGNLTELFAAQERELTGIDNNAGMISVARKTHARSGIVYKSMDMMDIDESFGFSAFDAVLCFGNTLAHLPSRGPVSAFCGKAAYVLAPDGLLIIQILNYDRIIAENIRELPALESADATLQRRYEWRDERMFFLTDLTDKKSGTVSQGGAELYPIGRKEFADVLDTAGFKNISWYGSAQGAPLTKDSFAMMAVCRR